MDTNHNAHHGTAHKSGFKFNWQAFFLIVIGGLLLLTWTNFANSKRILDRASTHIGGASSEVAKLQAHESINTFCHEKSKDFRTRLQDGDMTAAKELDEHFKKCEEMHRTADGFPLNPPPSAVIMVQAPTQAPPSSPAPAIQQPPVFTPSGNGREPVREFQILDAANHSYQLDARAAWTALPNLTAEPGTLEIRTDPTKKACSHSQLPCGGPEGTFDIVGNNAGSEYYPTNKTHYYALVAKWGDSGEVFEIGSYHCKPIPEYAYGRQLYVMANVPATARDLPGNSGGHRILSMQIKK